MIPNMHVVVPCRMYRGGQPDSIADWSRLNRMGIRTILKLNYPQEGIDDDAAALGMSVVTLSMPPCDVEEAVFGAPDEVDIASALAVLCEESNWPIYVHCTHGQDRTGLIVAMFRVVKQGWTTVAARSEALMNGFHPELIDLDRAWYHFVENQ